jgi:hypothetical protein
MVFLGAILKEICVGMGGERVQEPVKLYWSSCGG